MRISFNLSLIAKLNHNNLYTLCLFNLIEERNKLNYNEYEHLHFDRTIHSILPTEVFADFIRVVNFEAVIQERLVDLEYRISIEYEKRIFRY
jgi:hypothetical protein